ncbi:MAG: tRNA-Thr(GGU) m(6)t(6)A37 methyltransferase TsaA [Verrucomicrobiales bacterium]|jgi:tRNA-Thr(GGU) m(6)t(6)A37 methyltransferase TsaA
MKPLNTFKMEPIGHIESPFREKFGVPRQPGIVGSAEGTVWLREPFRREEMWRGLSEFSHVWLLWAFHLVPDQVAGGRTTVRPPRLGGNDRLGVFATRSPFRPNRIGLSAVKLIKVDAAKGSIRVGGIDLVDATPILDIKPYVPYCDAISDAVGGFASVCPAALSDFPISYSREALAFLATRDTADWVMLLEETLRADPRPAYQADGDRRYGLTLGPYNVLWNIQPSEILVQSIEATSTDLNHS